MNPSTMLLRKSAIDAVGGFYDWFPNSSVWDFTLRLTRHGLVHFLPVPYYMVPSTLDPYKRVPKMSKTLNYHAKSFQ